MHAHSRNRHAPRLEVDQDWERLLSWLPGGLDEIAVATGALQRRRVVKDGAMLLRLILMYAAGCFSLRDAAAWSARTLGVELTDDALAYRFIRAVPMLRQIFAQLLQVRLQEQRVAGKTLQILDATTFTEPGSAEVKWRLHTTFCPAANSLVGAELTDVTGVERVSRAAGNANDLLVLDRGYGHVRNIREAKNRGLACLVRVGLHNLPVADLEGRRLSPSRLLRAAKQGQLDHEVLLKERGGVPLRARLVLVPMPKEKAARARQRLRKTRKRKAGGRPRELTLRLAGYFCAVTTLSSEQASVQELLRWYGVRWQVELFFKRCKSLLHLAALPKAGRELIACLIWARLLLAMVVDKITSAAVASLHLAASAISLWRLTTIHWLDVFLAIYGGAHLADRLAHADQTLVRLRERPRRRCSRVSSCLRQITQVLGAARVPCSS